MTASPPSSAAAILSRIPLWVLVLVVPVVAGIAVAVRGFGSEPATQGGGGASRSTVVIEDFVFEPRSISVAAGSRIAVVNRDGAVHTLTAIDGTFDTGELASDERTSLTVDQPGTYAYLCDIHEYMRGTLRVT